MSALKLALVFVATIAVQLSVFVDVRVSGVAPELLALLAVLAGFLAGPERGPIVAFAAGLLWDIYLPTPLGLAAITFAIVAFSVASLEAGLYRDSPLQLALLSGLGTLAAVIGYALLGEVVGQRGLVDLRMLEIAVIAGLMNAALAPLVAPLMRWALRPEMPFRTSAAAP